MSRGRLMLDVDGEDLAEVREGKSSPVPPAS